MKYVDQVYGEFEITEPIILDLINSPSIQRLKEIDQAGYKPLWAKIAGKDINEYNYTRFIHSVGVYLLLRKYNTSIEEQIAGLIHDVSHSAFSHCIDYVLDVGSEKEHNHQDNIFEDFVKKSEIPQVLRKYNFNVDYILNEHNFPFLEKLLPDLCADRIDYSLKTAVIFGELDNEGKQYLLDNLITENNNWVFKNFESAKKYAELFFKLNTLYYAGFHSAVMFRTVGDCLRYALQKKYISGSNLYITDDAVIEKIGKFLDRDKRLKLLFNRMNNKVKANNNPNDYDARVFCKSRIVDPLFKKGNTIMRISETNNGWKEILKKESQPKEYFIKFND